MLAVAGCVTAVLLAMSGRYGYHRDELYFIAAGHHLAWGYPDQPVLVPLLARALSAVAPDSVAVLRVPSALAAGAVVVLTGRLTNEVGGGRPAQVLAAATMAVAPILLGTGHLLSTSTFDLLAWAVLVWLVLLTLRRTTNDLHPVGDPHPGGDRWWVVVGMVAGIGLLDSDLVAFLMGALVVGIAIAGPRRVFRSAWLWTGGAIAVAMWSPYLVWQASHGWPQLTISRAIAAGSSGSSQPRALFLPYQLGLVSVFLAPVWIAGLVRLLRDPALRWCRSIGWAYVVLAVVFLVTGGKAYYIAGLFPVLLAAGAQPAVDWLHRGRDRMRRRAFATALGLSAVVSVLITQPVLPVRVLSDTPIVSLNYDTGETIAWPAYVEEIAAVYRQLPPAQRGATAIVASNYGEAGAVDHYGPAWGLSPAHGVHNGYWYWGPPPDSTTVALAVGFTATDVAQFCTQASLATRLDNHLGIHNDEQGRPVWLCTTFRASWSTLWPKLRRLG